MARSSIATEGIFDCNDLISALVASLDAQCLLVTGQGFGLEHLTGSRIALRVLFIVNIRTSCVRERERCGPFEVEVDLSLTASVDVDPRYTTLGNLHSWIRVNAPPDHRATLALTATV